MIRNDQLEEHVNRCVGKSLSRMKHGIQFHLTCQLKENQPLPTKVENFPNQQKWRFEPTSKSVLLYAYADF